MKRPPPNKAGATPLHLAVPATGRGGSGSEHAREQQEGIIALLIERGANVRDRDGRGKDVRAIATSDRLRAVLHDAGAG